MNEHSEGKKQSAVLQRSIALLICTVALSPLFAQQSASSSAANEATVPGLVSFSGKLPDAQGKSTPGIAGITFAIYKDQEGGAPLWLETQNVRPDNQGRYTVQLGETSAHGLPIALFGSGEARWLGVRVNGGEEQPRVMLLSVPYALKAGDAATIGGLPPSAFVLASPGGARPVAVSEDAPKPAVAPTNPAVTGVGTVGSIPLWDSVSDLMSSAIVQTGSGSTARIGINTTPSTTLDVKGTSNFRGSATMPSAGLATSATGKNSYPFVFATSAYNSGTKAPVLENFRWQAEPVGNNSTNPSGTLNLLFSSGTATPVETGLKLSNNGIVTFAPGQTFPGTGTVTSVGFSAPASDFTVSGTPITNSGTFALNWNIAPTSSNTPNAIVKRDANGLIQTNAIGVGKLAATMINATTSITSVNATAVFGAVTSIGSGPTYGVTGFSSTDQGAGVYGNNNSAALGYGVIGKAPNGSGVFGSGAWGFDTDSNVHQSAAFGGWVKATLLVDSSTGTAKILRCFNSTLSGAAANTVPCGFSATYFSDSGFHIIGLGFDISHNFISALGVTFGSAVSGGMGLDCNCSNSTSDVILQLRSTQSGNLELGKFYVVVF